MRLTAVSETNKLSAFVLGDDRGSPASLPTTDALLYVESLRHAHRDIKDRLKALYSRILALDVHGFCMVQLILHILIYYACHTQCHRFVTSDIH